MQILDNADLYGYYFCMSYCYACGIKFPEDFKVYRTTECPSCGRDVKVCRNCAFYSPNSSMDCTENIQEAVTDKEKANFCDYFKLGDRTGDGSTDKKSRDARNAFNSLFGDE